MSPDQINAAIAKAVGYAPHSLEHAKALWFRPSEKHRLLERTVRIPLFASSLDAMASAEATLTESEMLIYVETLVFMVSEGQWTVCATAPQRAEAFLRVKGLWEPALGHKPGCSAS